jgi:hypothetical protein
VVEAFGRIAVPWRHRDTPQSWCKGSPVTRNTSEVLTKKKQPEKQRLKIVQLHDFKDIFMSAEMPPEIECGLTNAFGAAGARRDNIKVASGPGEFPTRRFLDHFTRTIRASAAHHKLA